MKLIFIDFQGTTANSERFNGIKTKIAKDFTDSSIIVEFAKLPAENIPGVGTRLEIGNAYNNKYYFEVDERLVRIRRFINSQEGVNIKNFTFSPINNRFVRIRHSTSDAKVYFETSPTGLDGTWEEKGFDDVLPTWLLNTFVSLNVGKKAANCTPPASCPNILSAFDNFRFVKNSTVTAKAGNDKVVTVNTTTTLNGSADGSPNSYKWTFTGKPSGAPDPTIDSPTGQNTTIGNLSFMGDYNFQLTVSDGTSFSTDQVRVRVTDSPTATISAPSTIIEDEPVIFDGTMSAGAYEYEWDFGDGNKAEIGRATHVYLKSRPTPYTVSLKVKNEAGEVSNIVEHSITVNPFPTASPTNTVTVNCAGTNAQRIENLNTAIGAASGRTDIVLPDGCIINYNGTGIDLPVKTGNDYIVIRSASAGSFAQGARVSRDNSADVAKMAILTIIGSSDESLIKARKNVHHYRFDGIYFKRLFAPVVPPAESTIYTHLIDLRATPAPPPNNQLFLSEVPHHFIFDHCIFENAAGAATRRGISLNSSDTSILNSALYNFRGNAGDSHAIGAWTTPGRHAIINNRLEGGSENLLYGGAEMEYRYVTPSDITIRGNYLIKPLAWREDDRKSSTAKDKPYAKNNFELKHAKNVIFDGNMLENNWIGADQKGQSILLTVRNQTETPGNGYTGENPWATIQNVQVTNNKTLNTPGAIQILGLDYGRFNNNQNQPIVPSVLAANLIIRNNLFDKMALPENHPPEYPVLAGRAFIISTGKRIGFRHNTFIYAGDSSIAGAIYGNDTLLTDDSEFVFNNNLMQINAEGFVGTPHSGEGGKAFLNAFVPGWKMENNVMFYFYAMMPGGPCGIPNGFNCPRYPAENRYAQDTQFASQFVDFANGDYNLTTGSFARNYPSAGINAGCNYSAVNAEITKAINGNWVLPN